MPRRSFFAGGARGHVDGGSQNRNRPAQWERKRFLTVWLLAAFIVLGSGCGTDSGTNPEPEVDATSGDGNPDGGAPDPGDGTPDPDGDTPDPGGGTPDPSSIIPTWYGVQANIFERYCTMCHSGPAPPEGLSWEVDQYDVIVTDQRLSNQVPSMLEVNPFDPDASYLYWKITDNPGIENAFMPATGVPLDQALIDVVEQWILAGAPLGDPADADSGGSGEPDHPVGSWMYVWTEALQVCVLCHSNDPADPRCGPGGDLICPPKDVVLTADNYSGVVDGGEVEPGDLDGSKLWDRVTDPDPDKRMPFEMPALSAEQLDVIRDWILDGAPLCPTGEDCP